MGYDEKHVIYNFISIIFSQITKVLGEIFDGSGSHCPNYKCKKHFPGGFENCLEYVKHCIICQPLFQCKKCKLEFKNEKYLKFNHTEEQCNNPSSSGKKKKFQSKNEVNIDRSVTEKINSKEVSFFLQIYLILN